MKANLNEGSLNHNTERDNTFNIAHSKTEAKKHAWMSPQLKEFGNLSFVVKGISYLPLDGLQNLTP
jgi:hypothetical protein